MTPETETETSYSRGRIVRRMILDIYEDKKDHCTKIVCIFLKHLKGNCADVHHSPFLSVFSGHVAIKKNVCVY